MKKIYSLAASILLIILTTAPFSGKAQVDTSTVQKLLQYIMQPLDKKPDTHRFFRRIWSACYSYGNF